MVTQKTLRNFETAVDLNNCLKQIKVPISIHTCAFISDLPSNLSITDLEFTTQNIL